MSIVNRRHLLSLLPGSRLEVLGESHCEQLFVEISKVYEMVVDIRLNLDSPDLSNYGFAHRKLLSRSELGRLAKNCQILTCFWYFRNSRDEN